jgi:hypothetical protein
MEDTLKFKARKCFEMSARLVSMAFATFEAEEDYRARIATTLHEFVQEFVKNLTQKQRDQSGLLFSKLAICNGPPKLQTLHAQSVVGLYEYHETPSIEVYLKHKEIRFRDLLHSNSPLDVAFTLEF